MPASGSARLPPTEMAPTGGAPALRAQPFGERAVLVDVGDMGAVHRMWSALRENRPEGVGEVVAGAKTLLLLSSGGPVDPAAIVAALPDPATLDAPLESRTVTIPVAYDGPDLDGVAEVAGLTARDVAQLHAAAEYTVGFLGFSPGFGYLFGGDRRLSVPRLASPRTTVPAGSVALAGGATAVYPQSTPGGWQLIGRTDAVLFDAGRERPALLSPGDRVCFEPVRELASPWMTGLWSPARPVPPGAPGVEVLEPGPLLTVQDQGRHGWAHVGVPVAGAADRGSAARANRLVGNPAGAALFESTLGGCRLRLRADRTVAVTGALVDVTVDGFPARIDVPLPLKAGSELALGPCRRGVRAYLAVAGGLDVAAVLGSRSTDTLSGLGPAPLAAGERVGLGGAAGGGAGGAERTAVPVPPPTPLPDPRTVLEVQARWGPRAGWLAPEGKQVFATAEFVVAASSDRTGVRMEGPRLRPGRDGQIPSEGMVAGAVQLPPGGHPIVLMRNHPPTGGYPVVAVVDESGVDALAQAAPGQRVRFAVNPTRTRVSGRG